MAKACIAFGMDSATEAWRHLMGDRQLVINYGNEFEGKYLQTYKTPFYQHSYKLLQQVFFAFQQML